ncbi:MAG: hypothetical protein H6R24_2472 [Proteobacteria bacterium]|nr:hypothetical protein [Pseudomonadota bacterium]
MNSPRFDDYPFEIRPLSAEDGGGYLITFLDLPGCMADGETPEDAIREGRDAFRCWMQAHIEDGRAIPWFWLSSRKAWDAANLMLELTVFTASLHVQRPSPRCF